MGLCQRFLVRFRGAVLVDVELVPGAYMIGRSAECALHLAHAVVSRRHGSLWHDEGGWKYRDLRREGAEPVEVTDDAPIELGPSLELVTGGYLVEHETASRPRPRERRPWLWTTLLLLVALSLSGGYLGYRRVTAPLPPGELLARARPSVVTLDARPSDATRAALIAATDLTEDDFLDAAPFCSGFVVAPDVIVTASHCVLSSDGAVRTDLEVTGDDGARHEVARVLGLNVKRDYMFLEVPTLDAEAPFELHEDFEVGERVYTLGDVQGEGLALRDGIASSITPDRDRPGVDYLRFSAPVSSGNSGGPLLDGRGRALGLVFSRNAAETYNVATPSEYLLDGMDRWVERRDGDTIPIGASDFPSHSVVRALGRLGYPSAGRWYERPELSRSFETARYTQRVPVTLEELSAQTTASFDEAIRPPYDAAVGELAQQGRFFGWDELVDGEHPLASPVRAPRAIPRHEDRVLPSDVGICSPSDSAGSIESARTYAGCSALARDAESSSVATSVFVSHRYGRPTLGRGYLSALSSRLAYARFHHSGRATEERPEASVARLLGDEGALLDLSRAEYLRPRARRPYPLASIPTEVVERFTVRDGLDREWTGFSLPVFDEGTVVVFCKAIPGGEICEGAFRAETDEAALARYRANHARYVLSRQVLRPGFLTRHMIERWRGADDFVLPTDFTYAPEGEGARLSFETAGFALRVEAPPEAIRIHRGLVRVDGETRWFASGADVVLERDGERVLCATRLRSPRSELEQITSRYGAYGGPRGDSAGAVTVGSDEAARDVSHDCIRLRQREQGYGPHWRPLDGAPPVTVEITAAGPA